MKNLFSTKERIKILTAVIFQTGPISVNQIASGLELSKGLVSKYLDILVRERIAKRAGGKFLVNQEDAGVRGIKILLNIRQIDIGLFKKFRFIQAVGLYGSCAKGENTEDSDVDLWIRISEVNQDRQAALASRLRKTIKNVRVLFLSGEKIKKLRKEDELFYHALSFGSIALYGVPNALEL